MDWGSVFCPPAPTQALRATKYSIKSTYNDLPCYLKVNRGKLALINRPRKCKKGKDRRSPLVHSQKLANMTISPALSPAVIVTVVRDTKIRTARWTNQIARFVTMPSWKKNKFQYHFWVITEGILMKNSKHVCLFFICRATQPGHYLIVFNTPQKSLLKSSYPTKYLQNFRSQKNPGIETFNPQKIFDHPHHLKSRVPPWALHKYFCQ